MMQPLPEQKEVLVDGVLLTRDRLDILFQDNHMPEHMEDGLYMYLTFRISPGSFMKAVLSNDLIMACEQADVINRNALYKWVVFMINYLPPACYGSPDNVAKWLDKK
jgi:hypothetical protein